MADKITLTDGDLREALGPSQFKLTFTERAALIKSLNKRINPPAWRVETGVNTEGAKVPTIRYKDNLLFLEVYSGIARPDMDRREHVAELIAELLEERGLEV